jgi:pseudouridine-5'-phosphate glycosidase
MFEKPEWLDLADEVAEALRNGKPVVALESTLIAHGLPWPMNRDTALEAEAAVRHAGAIPATIAVWGGRPTIGLSRDRIADLAQMSGVLKASRRDLAAAIVQNKTAATTVAATIFLAHGVGIPVFATGGIGGAHRKPAFDISADLAELARTPVQVVCAGAKSILHLPRTLEILETLGVPIVGYRTDTLPAFTVRDSWLRLPSRVENPDEAARLFKIHRHLCRSGSATAMILAQPVAADVALGAEEFETALHGAEADATKANVTGPALTPFLLRRVAELTEGKSLRANRALIVANASLAGEVAERLAQA